MNGEEIKADGVTESVPEVAVVAESVPVQKVKKVKKKKKHRFLKFILFNAVLTLLCVGVPKFFNALAQTEMDSFVSNYPFSFENSINMLEYVTDNFSVITSYTVGEEEYNVTWSTDSGAITIDEEGYAVVTRPVEENESVTLTQTYKKGLGKGKIKYTVNVVASNTQTKEDISVVTLESVRDGVYNRDMSAVLNAEGELRYLDGDFKNTYVKSAEDAAVILEAYREEFAVNPNVTFSLRTIGTTELYMTYMFDVMYEGIVVDGDSASVVADSDTLKLSYVSIDSDMGDVALGEEIEPDCKAVFDAYISETEEYAGKEYAMVLYDKKVNGNGYLYEYVVTFKTEGIFVVLIQDNQVISMEREMGNIMENHGEYDRGVQDVLEEEMSNTLKVEFEPAKCSGVDEKGKVRSFDASRVKNVDKILPSYGKDMYVLRDESRNIEVLDNMGTYKLSSFLMEKGEILSGTGIFTIKGLEMMFASAGLDYLEHRFANVDIKSPTAEFGAENAVAVQAFDNMQDIYDFYLKNFGLRSYDNKGTYIPVTVDDDSTADNAGWCERYKMIAINPSKDFIYSTGYYKEVLGHEFTHAVFNQKVNGSNYEVSGISEACADIMGCLINPECNWTICENVYARDIFFIKDGSIAGKKGETFTMRDPKVINSDRMQFKFTYPEKYQGEGWNTECHSIASILSNIAYKMYASKYFDTTGVAKIWYNSLSKPYDSKSTYVDCRFHVIAAADALDYEDAAIDFIATCFDEANILDPTYKFKTMEKKSEGNVASDGSTILKTEANAVKGDAILDNSTSRKYLVMYSPADLVLGKGNVVIYEARKGVLWMQDDTEVGKRVEDMFNKAYAGVNVNGVPITVEYKAVNPAVMGAAERFCKDAKGLAREITMEYIAKSGTDMTVEDREMVDEVLDKVFKYVFQWKISDVTPYELFDGLNLIE